MNKIIFKQYRKIRTKDSMNRFKNDGGNGGTSETRDSVCKKRTINFCSRYR